MKIAFCGGNQAGIIGFLALLAGGHQIISVVSYSDDLTSLVSLFALYWDKRPIPVFKTIHDEEFKESLSTADCLVSVHSKEIFPMLPIPAFNVHPYLYAYKGADPVNRALKDKNFKASAGAHRITHKIDSGEVLCEEFIDVSGASSVVEIYNKLYPVYARVVIRAIRMMEGI